MKKIILLWSVLWLMVAGASAQSILKISLSNDSCAAGDSVKVVYAITGFSSLTQFEFQWSDASGNFSSPQTVLSFNDSSTSQVNRVSYAKVPCSFSGSGFKLAIKTNVVTITYDTFDFKSGPNAIFLVDTTAACPKVGSFKLTNNSTIGSGTIRYSWTFGGATPDTSTLVTPAQLIYNTSGQKTIKLVVTSNFGCKDSTFTLRTIRPQPSASFVVDTAAACIKVGSFKLSNVSSIASGTMSYSWTFGGATPDTSTLVTPAQLIYNTSGQKTIKLVVTSNFGCKDSTFTFRTIRPQPSASFSVDTAAACIKVGSFKLTGSAGAMSYSWTFGGATPDTSSLLNPPQLIYNTSGQKTIKLVVTSNFGCKDSTFTFRTIRPQPSASFTVDTAAACPKVGSFKLSNVSSIASGTMSYSWTFGGATPDTSTLVTPAQLIYNTSGQKTIKLVVTSNFGCKDSTFTFRTIRPQPSASFLVDTAAACPKLGSFKLSNVSSIASGTMSYSWTFGGATPDTSTLVTPAQLIYNTSGQKTIKLVVTSNFGCKDSTFTFRTIRPQPSASFQVDTAAACIKVGSFKLTNNSTIGSGTMSYSWTFGGATPDTSTLVTPAQLIYNTSGQKTIKLVVTSNFGCKDSTFTFRTIRPQPSASFLVDTAAACPKLGSFKLSNVSSIASGTMRYSWTFGGATPDTSSLVTPAQLIYNTSGQKTIKLVVTSNFGCKDSVSLNRTIRPRPKADFLIDSSGKCINAQNFIFKDSSSIYMSGTIVKYFWKYGGALTDTSSAKQNLINNYLRPGLKSITLIVTSDSGCIDSVTKNIYVHEKPYSHIQKSNPKICFSGNSGIELVEDTITNQARVFYNWSRSNVTNIQGTSGQLLNDSLIKIGLQNNTDTFQHTRFSVTPVTSFGCVGDTQFVTITVFPKPKVFSNNGGFQSICSGDFSQPIQFTSPTKFIDSLVRKSSISGLGVSGFINNNSFNLPSVQLFNSDSNVAFVSYKTTPFAYGCVGDTIRDTIFIKPNPRIVQLNPAQQTICSGDNSQAVLLKTQTAYLKTFYTFKAKSLKNTSSGFQAQGLLPVGSLLPAYSITNIGKRIDTILFEITPKYVFDHAGKPFDTCVGSSTNYIIIVNPRPALKLISNAAICSGDNFTGVHFTTDLLDSGTYYIWTEKLNGVSKLSGNNSGRGDIPAFTYNNNQRFSDSAEYQVRSYFAFNGDTCFGEQRKFTLVVNPRPNVTVRAADTICSEARFPTLVLSNDLNKNLPPAARKGNTYNWKLVYKSAFISTAPTPSGTGDSIPGQILINSSRLEPDTGSIVYEITPYYNNPNALAPNTCEGTRFYYRVLVWPNPAYPVIDTFENGTLCAGSRGLNYSVETDVLKKYSWRTAPDDAEIQGVNSSSCLINIPQTPADKVYKIFVTATNKYQCKAESFVNLDLDTNQKSPAPSDVLLVQNNTLICANNQAACYQWGRDLKYNLTPEILAGEVFQKYHAGANLDTASYHYWVITCGSNQTCKTKSYYNGPSKFINGASVAAGVASGLQVYPNPSDKGWNVVLPDFIPSKTRLKITVLSLSGETMSSEELLKSGENIAIDPEHLAPGIYLLKIEASTFIQTIKLVKTNP